MLRRYHLCLPAVLLSLSVSAVADIILTNGADLNMNGSAGSTIIFSDGTIQSTATVAGPQGDTGAAGSDARSEEHTSELQSQAYLVCRLLLEKKKKKQNATEYRQKPPKDATPRTTDHINEELGPTKRIH